jgi:hypothetical protein
MIKVKELEDHSFEISWDENDPVESMMNHWEEEDFIRAIREELKKDELR